MRLGMNAVLPCGTDARRRTHWAYGELCVTCEPSVEWTIVCSACLADVTVVGGVIEEHDVDSQWPDGAGAIECPGSGERAMSPAPRRRALPVAVCVRGVA